MEFPFLQLFEAMTRDQAMRILGVSPGDLDAASLKQARNTKIRSAHPDKQGGDTEQAALVNAAYDLLKGLLSGDRYRTDTSDYEPYDPTPKGRETQVPVWAWAGHSGGMPPSASIYRNDYTDLNYIKKTMWELSGGSKEQWTVMAFDGRFFRHSLTCYGSPEIFHEMSEAVGIWNSHGGNPYATRAIFVQKGRDPALLLTYADSKFYDPPIPFEHDSFNLNPGNDQQFVRRLPGMLDKLRDTGSL